MIKQLEDKIISETRGNWMYVNQEYTQIQLIVKKAQLEYAKKAYNDIDILLQTARSNLCYALGEYERAVKKAKESLV